MRLIGRFFQFSQRILKAAEKAGLSKVDIAKLKRLLDRTAKRNVILAKGILTALNAGGATKGEIKQFSELLEKAHMRIGAGKEPFTEEDKKQLTRIFKRASLSAKAARWFSTQLDDLLAEEIEDFIEGKKTIGIPTKKVVTFEEKKKKTTAKV